MRTKKILRSNVEVSKKEIFNALMRIIYHESEVDYIKIFEKEFAKYIGTKHAIATFSGRSAFYLILKSLDLEKGNEVIVPSYTVHIVPNIIRLFGLRPVFVDANERTYNINTNLIEEKITKRTKAIIPTHLYGQPCDMNPILELSGRYNLKVIEDSCHACGSEYRGIKTGTFGDANFFSFAIGKNLTTFGGGMITTNDDELAEKIRYNTKEFPFPSRFEILKRFFSYSLVWALSCPYVFTFTIYPALRFSDTIGSKRISGSFNDPQIMLKIFPDHWKKKFTNFQALLGLEQLKKIDKQNEKRIKNAKFLSSELENLDLEVPYEIPKVKHIYLNYPIGVKEKEEVARELLKKGVDVKREYIYSCSSLDIFKEFRLKCPIADRLERKTLFLPIHTSLSEFDLSYIVNSLKGILEGRSTNERYYFKN